MLYSPFLDANDYCQLDIQKFYINLNLSMASLKEERTVNFVYQNFTIDCNLIKNIIKIINNKSKKIVF